jgi:LuxR family transcriptional regulator, quorum-sensing system regulator SolR
MVNLGGKYKGTHLTPREKECITKFLEGKTVKRTAECFGLSPKTVQFYLNNIKNKLNCHSKNDLLQKIKEFGLTVDNIN